MKVQGFLLFLFVVGTCAQSFQGTWTDAVGGFLYICTTGPTSIGGVYSELGTIEGDTRVTLGSFVVSGTWADSGFNEYANGGFNWTLSADGNSFSGIYWYEDQPCITFEWNANRISTDIPATDECRVPSSSSTVFGTWTSSTSDTIDICLENGFYYASYSIGSSVGYSTGRTTSSSRVLQGTFFDSIAGQGIESFWLIDSGTLIQTSWLSLLHPSEASFDDSTHSSITWTRSSSNTQDLTCAQQRSLAGIDWNGVFTDKGFGSGRLFTCLDDAGAVTGVYSEMGWVDGTVDGSGLRLSGTFYDGGNRRSDHGSFTLTQSASGFKFSGSFTIPGVSTPQSWSETRRDITNFFSTECYGYDTSTLTLSGQWLMGPASTDVFDVCLTPDGAITGSYEYSNGVRGYVSGFYYKGGKTAQVEWFEAVTQGIQITRHTGDDLLTNSWWGFYDAGDFFFQICDDDEPNKQYAYHNVDSYSRVQTTTTSKRCNRNSDLFNARDQQTPSTEKKSSNSNSEASALNVNTMLVLSMSALAFLIYSLF